MAKRRKTKRTKKSDLCPICGQIADLWVTSCKHDPYIDDKCYPKMCFGCFRVPVEEVQKYNTDNTIKSIEGPFWDHRHLHTAQELVDLGSCDTLAEARKCVKGVRAALKAAGLTRRKKPKPKKRPIQKVESPER